MTTNMLVTIKELTFVVVVEVVNRVILVVVIINHLTTGVQPLVLLVPNIENVEIVHHVVKQRAHVILLNILLQMMEMVEPAHLPQIVSAMVVLLQHFHVLVQDILLLATLLLLVAAVGHLILPQEYALL